MLQNRILEARTRAKMTQDDLAKVLKIGKRTLIDYEKGVSEPKASTIVDIAELCNIDSGWLLTGKGKMVVSETENIPVVQEKYSEDNKNTISVNYYPDVYAAAGYGGINGDSKPEIMTVSKSFLFNMFGLSSFIGIDIIHVVGDSMEPFIPNGETILLQRTHEARNNQVIIARINDELYVKRLLRDPMGRWIKLISDNKQYPDIDLNQEEMKQLEIIGIVYGRYRPIS